MLILFMMIFAVGAWFLIDGYWVWPREAQRYEAFAEIRDRLIEAGEAEDGESSTVLLAWKRHAEEADYPAEVPEERTDAAIAEQRVIGWTLMTGAILFGLWILWNHRLSIRAEGDTIIGASGQRVNLDSIIATDRKKWEKKGIAYAIYEEDGKRKRLTLDDHKFAGCEAILLEAEERIRNRDKPEKAPESGTSQPPSP